jgi:hypothetical protein
MKAEIRVALIWEEEEEEEDKTRRTNGTVRTRMNL